MTGSDWDAVATTAYDLRIMTCGYETRASFVAQRLTSDGDRTIVLDYECEGVFRYDDNKEYYLSLSNAELIPIDDKLTRSLTQRFMGLLQTQEPEMILKVLLDVSSCSRSVMAKVLLTIASVLGSRAEITCVYALSAFESPPQSELPSHISEPVVGDLSGWSDDLSKPPCAVIGLGFEPGRALGCMDYLEIPEVRLFMPVGADERFESAVRDANAVLIAEASELSVLPYSVLDPTATYEKLESLIFGLLPNFRPVLIPLGPKIFAAVSMALAIKLLPQVCVWRTSAGSGAEIADRKASGEVAVLVTRFS